MACHFGRNVVQWSCAPASQKVEGVEPSVIRDPELDCSIPPWAEAQDFDCFEDELTFCVGENHTVRVGHIFEPCLGFGVFAISATHTF